jgi:hypothetical protein
VRVDAQRAAVVTAADKRIVDGLVAPRRNALVLCTRMWAFAPWHRNTEIDADLTRVRLAECADVGTLVGTHHAVRQWGSTAVNVAEHGGSFVSESRTSRGAAVVPLLAVRRWLVRHIVTSERVAVGSLQGVLTAWWRRSPNQPFGQPHLKQTVVLSLVLPVYGSVDQWSKRGLRTF